MNTGTVKFYNDQKGFGFIQPDNGDKDVFVHATALERAGISGLREGQKDGVTSVGNGRRGAPRRLSKPPLGSGFFVFSKRILEWLKRN